jgi:hypothetical protein
MKMMSGGEQTKSAEPGGAAWLGGGPIRLRGPDRDRGPYEAELHWAAVDGVARLVGFSMRSVESFDAPAYERRPQPVTGASRPFAPITSLRSIDFSELVRDSRKAIFMMELLDTDEFLTELHNEYAKRHPGYEPKSGPRPEIIVNGVLTPSDRDAGGAKQRLAAIERAGRGGQLPDSHYRHVGRVYLAAHNAGRTDVLNAIIEEFQGTSAFPRVTKAMAHHWRRVARERQYIPPEIKSTRGRPRRTDPPCAAPREDT